MLKRFEVRGFKNFLHQYVLDFSNVRDYKFSEQCIQNDLIKNAIIYGKNASGKTNLGLALFDIVSHMTGNNVTPGLYDEYANANNMRGVVEFRYVFQFGTSIVDYTYEKSNGRELLSETLTLNDMLFLRKDYQNSQNDDFTGINELAPTLNFAFVKEESVLRYVLNNTSLSPEHSLYQMMDFVSNMLWYRSLDENRYIGYKENAKDYIKFILEDEEALREFQALLNQAGMDDILLSVDEGPDGKRKLYSSKEGSLHRLPFLATASSGTKALYNYFYWIKTSPRISFLFIDEFDAYYHFELAETIVISLQSANMQTLLTSHNTNLLSNRIMRPDCYFIINDKRIVSIADASPRELREGHNLEKLYQSGDFDE